MRPMKLNQRAIILGALVLTGALLLNWPEAEEGFVVEGAPAPNGPWTSVDAPQFVRDGSLTVAVPTGREQKFFRLAKQ